MLELVYLLRAMQLFSHSAHHLCKGAPFFADHEFFGETYKELGDDFDAVSEHFIGLEGAEDFDSVYITTEAAEKLKESPIVGSPVNEFFNFQKKLEKQLCEMIEKLSDEVTIGTEQLIGEIANKSEMRQYKLRQRLQK